jgi:Lon protease-like protein
VNPARERVLCVSVCVLLVEKSPHIDAWVQPSLTRMIFNRCSPHTASTCLSFTKVPFDAQEVMLPGEEKTLHLYEARYLSLFDEVVTRYDSKFGHVLLSHERKALAAVGTLVRISEWTRLELGVKIKLEAIGRLHVSAVEQLSLPFITGTVAYLDDDDEAVEVPELLDLEREFWKLATKIATHAARLDISPVRTKLEVSPPTLAEEVVRSIDLGKGPSQSVEERTAACLENLREAVRRASWPCSSQSDIEAKSSSQIAQRTQSRLRAISFVGFELFPSDAGQRQRALELKSTLDRMERTLVGCRARAKLLEAQLALRIAFPDRED